MPARALILLSILLVSLAIGTPTGSALPVRLDCSLQSRTGENSVLVAQTGVQNACRLSRYGWSAYVGKSDTPGARQNRVANGLVLGTYVPEVSYTAYATEYGQNFIPNIGPATSHFGRDPPVRLQPSTVYDGGTRYDEVNGFSLAAEDPVTEEGIQQIEQHLARPELNALNDPANQAMIARLRAGSTTPQDLNFYNHELYEKGLMDAGVSARDAHMQTLQWQGIPYEPGYEAQLYHPSVIQQFPEYFNPAAYPQH